MAADTILSLTDNLPLTCSRAGTCCHGKMVNLNPWELFRLARAKNLTPREFRDTHCDFGGIRLKFDGEAGWKGLPACCLYKPDFGCMAHSGRPLVCRLYPLGQQILNEERRYLFQGEEFPCLEGCPEVLDLPHLTVADYIAGQGAEDFEAAQNAYLEIMQNIADGAFVLLLDSGLVDSGDRKTLGLWRKMGSEKPEQLTERIGSLWIDRLMLPEITGSKNDPIAFANSHYDLLIFEAEESFATSNDLSGYREASALMMGLALHLGRSLGAQPADLADKWIAVAKQNGALE